MRRKQSNRQVFKALALVSQIGINMLVPIVLCFFIGRWIDQTFNTSFWVLIFLLLGILSSYKSLYNTTKSFMRKDDTDNEKN